MTRTGSKQANRLVRFVGICALQVGLALQANAMPTIIFSNNTTLYRITGQTIETFEITDALGGMATAPDGVVWATGTADIDGDGKVSLYKINDPYGNPFLQLQGDFLPKPDPVSLGFINDTMYFMGRDHEMYTIDPIAQSVSLVG